MITLTKNCIAVRISDNHFHGRLGSDSITAVNTLIDISCDALRSNKQVAYKGFGKLVPKIKEGGRPVRNPKTGEEKTMSEVATVTMPSSQSSKNKASNQGKVNTSELISELKTRLRTKLRSSPSEIDKLAEATVREFISALSETETCKVRIEIRGFGVFSAKEAGPRNSINPKTQVKFVKNGGIRKHFKVSKPFRAELLPSLKEHTLNAGTN